MKKLMMLLLTLGCMMLAGCCSAVLVGAQNAETEAEITYLKVSCRQGSYRVPGDEMSRMHATLWLLLHITDNCRTTPILEDVDAQWNFVFFNLSATLPYSKESCKMLTDFIVPKDELQSMSPACRRYYYSILADKFECPLIFR